MITITKPGRFSFFRAPAKSVMPYKAADIKGVYQYITLYSPALSATNAFRAIDDSKQAREFKASHFDFVCFSGIFSYRKDDGLIKHSGLLCLDFDHVGNRHDLWELRQQLIADPFFTTWLKSSSAKASTSPKATATGSNSASPSATDLAKQEEAFTTTSAA